MENTSPNDPAPALVTTLINKKLNDPNGPKESTEPSPEKIVMCDECGDTLWDDVLAQDDKIPALTIRNDGNEDENISAVEKE